MKNALFSIAILLSTAAGHAYADNRTGQAMLGGALGGAIGAAIGHDAGGRDGAILGSALGAATGTALTTNNSRHTHTRDVIIYRDGGRYRHDNGLHKGHYKRHHKRKKHDYDD